MKCMSKVLSYFKNPEILLPTLFIIGCIIVKILRVMEIDIIIHNSFLFSGVYSISGAFIFILSVVQLGIFQNLFTHNMMSRLVGDAYTSAATDRGTNIGLLKFFAINIAFWFAFGYLIRMIVLCFQKICTFYRDTKKAPVIK